VRQRGQDGGWQKRQVDGEVMEARHVDKFDLLSSRKKCHMVSSVHTQVMGPISDVSASSHHDLKTRKMKVR